MSAGLHAGAFEPKGLTVLVTGAAGFIGFHTTQGLLARGARVIGVDNLNDYYDVSLKADRLAQLEAKGDFAFHKAEISDLVALSAIPRLSDVSVVIHLAAQAGVRHSLDKPFDYAQSNMVGHLTVLELCRHNPNISRLVYASSSSVYGANSNSPFRETDAVDHPVSLYAATKRSAELLSETYARLFGIPQIGLRFFSVYGPWGRPDMAYWTFTRNVLDGRPVPIFNEGKLARDFTYVDDIVAGILAVALEPAHFEGEAPHRIYNIANGNSVPLMDFVRLIERFTGREAIIDMKPMQPGDVVSTHGSIDSLAKDYGYAPSVPLGIGMERFVRWFAERNKA